MTRYEHRRRLPAGGAGPSCPRTWPRCSPDQRVKTWSCARSSRRPGSRARLASTPNTRPTSTMWPTRRSTGPAPTCPLTSRRPSRMHRSRSAPSGLLEVAEQHDATMIVLGSALCRGIRAHRTRQRHRPAVAQLARSRWRWQPADSAADPVAGSPGSLSRMAGRSRPTTWSSRPASSPAQDGRHRCGWPRSPSGHRPRTTTGSASKKKTRGRVGRGLEAAAQKALQQAKDLTPSRSAGGGDRVRRGLG